jgi:hypothetical protein
MRDLLGGEPLQLMIIGGIDGEACVVVAGVGRLDGSSRRQHVIGSIKIIDVRRRDDRQLDRTVDANSSHIDVRVRPSTAICDVSRKDDAACTVNCSIVVLGSDQPQRRPRGMSQRDVLEFIEIPFGVPLAQSWSDRVGHRGFDVPGCDHSGQTSQGHRQVDAHGLMLPRATGHEWPAMQIAQEFVPAWLARKPGAGDLATTPSTRRQPDQLTREFLGERKERLAGSRVRS